MLQNGSFGDMMASKRVWVSGKMMSGRCRTPNTHLVVGLWTKYETLGCAIGFLYFISNRNCIIGCPIARRGAFGIQWLIFVSKFASPSDWDLILDLWSCSTVHIRSIHCYSNECHFYNVDYIDPCVMMTKHMFVEQAHVKTPPQIPAYADKSRRRL